MTQMTHTRRTRRDDGNDEVRDGEGVVVPMTLMDQRNIARLHKPGFVELGDADIQRRQAALEARKSELESAWKIPIGDRLQLTRPELLRLAQAVASLLQLPMPVGFASNLPKGSEEEKAINSFGGDAASVSDAAAAYEERNRRLENAWRARPVLEDDGA